MSKNALELEYEILVDACATQGRQLAYLNALSGTPEKLYLYYRASEQGRGPGKLFLAPASATVPEWAKLVTSEGLSIAEPYDRYYQWVYDRARRAPILSY
jgi:hypothetical protein